MITEGSFEKRVGNEEKVLIFQYPKINYPLKIQKSHTLFETALDIQAPWYVKSVDFNVAAKRLDIDVDFERGSRFRDVYEGEGR